MFVTSSIRLSMKVIKKLSRTPIANQFKKSSFWSFFWHSYVKMQGSHAFIFTELYRKVRKLTEGQNCLARSHLTSYGRNSSFLLSYHSTWSYWQFTSLFVVYRLRDTVDEWSRWMVQVVPQIEAFFALIWKIVISWPIDLQTGSSDKKP